MIYKVRVTYTEEYSGELFIEAEDEDEAKDIVKNNTFEYIDKIRREDREVFEGTEDWKIDDYIEELYDDELEDYQDEIDNID